MRGAGRRLRSALLDVSGADRVYQTLPPRMFLYTLDQIADMLQYPDLSAFIFYHGRSVGVPPRDKLQARNVAPEGERPEWRVEERELVRWMRFKRISPGREPRTRRPR